jgi:exopolysaccharide biosynthesis polyprenyl glycosylphosphotransferase
MSRPSLRLGAIALDTTGLVAALACSGLWTRAADDAATTVLDRAAVTAMFALAWLAIANHIGVYRVSPRHDLRQSMRRALEAWAATWGVAGLLAISTLAPKGFSIWFALVAVTALLLLARCLLAALPWARGAERTRAVVIGTDPTGCSVSRRDADSGLHLLGVVPFTNEDASTVRDLPALGTLAELPRILRERDVDVAVVSPSDAAITGEVRYAFRTCGDHDVAVHFFPSLLDVDHERVRITWDASRELLDVVTMAKPRRVLARAGKRALDVVGSALGILALLPVFVACAVAVKLTSPGPILFRQQRVGERGRLFSCLKFRTMRVGAHSQQELLRAASTQDGPAFKMPSDPRVTRVGRILRKFSLDELPQMFNVLLGDMSLVGPRPPIPSEVDRYEWWQRRRVSVKPGLTCLWQVYGRNRVSFKRWVEMDLYYIDNWSLWMDVKLIAHTFRVVIRGTGM